MQDSTKKEIRNWGIFLLLAAGLYLSGWHTEVIGRLQQVLLYSNLFQPTLYEETTPEVNDRVVDINSFVTPINALAQTEFTSRDSTAIYFINFWATWCPPCVAEMPDIAALKKDIDNRDWPIRFIMVSLDSEPRKAQQFIERKELDLPIYSLQHRLPARFDTGTIPSTYVLDHTGKIIAERHGMARYHTDRFLDFLHQHLRQNNTPTD